MKKTCILCAGVALCLATLAAQDISGSITGSVLDASGSAVPDAKVTITNTDRNAVIRSMLTDANGEYVAPLLPIGRYAVTVEARGFKKSVKDNFVLETAAHPVIDLQLLVGDIAQSVSVVGDAALVETTNGSVAEPITHKQVENLPLNGRTPYLLSELAIGVTAEPNGSGQQGDLKANPWDNSASTTFSSGGAQIGRASCRERV